MLRDPHQFHMGISHIFDVFHQAFGKLTIGIESFGILFGIRMLHPGSGVYFIDRDGSGFRIEVIPILHPDRVSPAITDIRHPGCRSRPLFRCKRIRIRLIQLPAVASYDQVFVEHAFFCIGYERFKYADVRDFLHRIGLLVPLIAFADHIHRYGVRCPDGKPDAVLPVFFRGMCPHLFIQVIMRGMSE